ncbi:hypothetical protein JG688_00009477 [Phytophthora aleatoria]|uniref:Uncharacterized protein n=1 Tax=Phytophthora aleatoria TaxID=2496075 RepID=A0A8J5IX79_9STRA|nr:hypothetical protein JG688_00009477 [Phytophthora aleatoria]
MRIVDPIQDRAHRLLSLHAAEIYSDMHAEYIAMGCSYAILFFFGAHPKTALVVTPPLSTGPTRASLGFSSASKLLLISWRVHSRFVEALTSSNLTKMIPFLLCS